MIVAESSSNTMPLAIIVGAGPAGLCFANLLTKYAQDFFIIDSRIAPSSLSKATGIHRNTLKLLDKIDLIEEITRRSILLNANNLVVDGRLNKKIVFQQGEHQNDKNISLDQADLEEILLSNLSVQSDRLKFGKQMIDFEQTDEYVEVTVEECTTHRIEKIQAKYLIAADGAKSFVIGLCK